MVYLKQHDIFSMPEDSDGNRPEQSHSFDINYHEGIANKANLI